MELEKFNFKTGSLELKSCNKNLLSDLPHESAEIVQWTNDDKHNSYCFTVAFWKENKENIFDLKFVGSRFLEVDESDLLCLMKKGQLELENQLNLFNE